MRLRRPCVKCIVLNILDLNLIFLLLFMSEVYPHWAGVLLVFCRLYLVAGYLQRKAHYYFYGQPFPLNPLTHNTSVGTSFLCSLLSFGSDNSDVHLAKNIAS